MTEGKKAVLGLGIVLAVFILVLGYRQFSSRPRQGGETALARSPVSASEPDTFKQVAQLLEKGKLDESLPVLEQIIATSQNPELLGKAWWLIADVHQKKGDLKAAREALKTLVYQFSSSGVVASAQQRLSDVNMKILFSPIITEDSFLYEVQPGDSLYTLARKYGTTVDLLKRANNLKSDRIIVGDKLKISTARFGVVISKSRNSLTLKSGEDVLKVYPVATGKGGLTPSGVFMVENKLIDPPWYRPGEVIPAGNPKNILGSRWIGLSAEGYGIHGTNDPESIGSACTEGCVRMRNEDVEELFAILPVKTEVVIID